MSIWFSLSILSISLLLGTCGSDDNAKNSGRWKIQSPDKNLIVNVSHDSGRLLKNALSKSGHWSSGVFSIRIDDARSSSILKVRATEIRYFLRKHIRRWKPSTIFWSDTSGQHIVDHRTSISGLQRFYHHATKVELIELNSELANRFSLDRNVSPVSHRRNRRGE